MLFDTDVLIWVLRGNANAARAVDQADERAISIVTYMELLQGARDKREIRVIKGFLGEFRFGTAPLSENIGHRASIYLLEYGLSISMSLADALVAATAVEGRQTLLTANLRHYRPIRDLAVRVFRP
jgi:predicted nucleic acid-binding protein